MLKNRYRLGERKNNYLNYAIITEKKRKITNSVSTKSFRGRSLSSGTLKRIEHKPPLPS